MAFRLLFDRAEEKRYFVKGTDLFGIRVAEEYGEREGQREGRLEGIFCFCFPFLFARYSRQ